MTRGFSRFALLALGVLGIIAACVFVFRRDVASARTPKTFGRDMADMIRVWNPKTGVDCVHIKSCRIEKRKLGPITFGGLNVLLLEDVVINLPFPEDVSTNFAQSVSLSEEASTRESGSERFLPLLEGIIPPSVRASGIRIAGLEVNRVENGKRVSPIFTASGLRDHGAKLLLSDCCVLENGRTNFVGEATLSFSPEAVLSWEGGQLCLEDLLSTTTHANVAKE